jgi:polar amino acid transport system permease protein
MSAWQILAAEAPRFFTWWNMLFLGQAVLNTLVASVAGCAVGYALGFALATLRLPQVMPFGAVRAPPP